MRTGDRWLEPTTPKASGLAQDQVQRTVAMAVLAQMIGTAPITLCGTLAIRIHKDLSFDVAVLGLLAPCIHATAAGSSVLVSRLGERMGARGGSGSPWRPPS